MASTAILQAGAGTEQKKVAKTISKVCRGTGVPEGPSFSRKRQVAKMRRPFLKYYDPNGDDLFLFRASIKLKHRITPIIPMD